MKANEMRPGNLFLDEENEVQILSCTNRLGDFVVEDNRNWMGYVIIKNDLAKPIPLNQEWIEKFGFKKEYDTYWVLWFDEWHFSWGVHLNGNKYFRIDADGGYDTGGEHDILDKCKYVHQFQNLYFALTGIELTIKINEK